MRVSELFYSKKGKLFAIWRLLRLLIIIVPIAIIGNYLFNLLKIEFSFNRIFNQIFIAAIILVTQVSHLQSKQLIY
jgi:hypothetical protein